MWDKGGSDEILGVQHDASVGLSVGQGLIGGEWVCCGDGDVQITGCGEGGQFGRRREAAGVGRSARFDALFFRSAVVDDGVDAVCRNAEAEGEREPRPCAAFSTGLTHYPATGPACPLIEEPPA